MTPPDQRPPSTQWEPAALPGLPQSPVWLWFGAGEVHVSVPPETHAPPWNPAGPLPVTARMLAAAAGLDAARVAGWSAFGQSFDAQGGANPLLDQPLPPTPGTPVQVTFTIAAAPAPAVPPAGQADSGLLGVLAAAPQVDGAVAAAPPSDWKAGPSVPSREAAADPDAARTLTAMEADWNAIQQLERQLNAVTKQLNAMQGKLQTLNRDLNPVERVAADSNDVKDWNDVRRFLRDRSAEVSRQIRAFDIGTVSAAGDRRRLEDIVEQYVRTKRPFPQMAAAAQQFEAHRKTCQTLLSQSSNALSKANSEGEAKARVVLQRIAKKARDKRAKR